LLLKLIFIQYPKALYSAYPQPLQELYLHVFNCIPTYSMMNYDNRRVVFYNLFNNKSGFGILSTKNMAQVEIFTYILWNMYSI